jgi:hypothetical protein
MRKGGMAREKTGEKNLTTKDTKYHKGEQWNADEAIKSI